MPKTEAVPLTAVVAVLTITATSCSYALMGHREVAGRAFDVEVASQLPKGASWAEAMNALGPPYRREETGERETWFYYSVAQLRGCRVKVFGIVPVRQPPFVTTEARLEFRENRLAEVDTEVRDGRKAPSLE